MAAVLDECIWPHLGKRQFLEVVTSCDHLGFLSSVKLEHEDREKTVCVAFDGLVQCRGGHALRIGLIGIDHDPLAAQYLNPSLVRGKSTGVSGGRQVAMTTKQEVCEFAKTQGVSEEKSLEVGMESMSEEFKKAGGEIYMPLNMG